MDYAMVIKEYMKQKGITYEELAVGMGVSRQRAWYMLNGKSVMNLKTLDKVTSVLGIKLNIL